jgi:hypothetical protein
LAAPDNEKHDGQTNEQGEQDSDRTHGTSNGRSLDWLRATNGRRLLVLLFFGHFCKDALDGLVGAGGDSAAELALEPGHEVGGFGAGEVDDAAEFAVGLGDDGIGAALGGVGGGEFDGGGGLEEGEVEVGLGSVLDAAEWILIEEALELGLTANDGGAREAEVLGQGGLDLGLERGGIGGGTVEQDVAARENLLPSGQRRSWPWQGQACLDLN